MHTLKRTRTIRSVAVVIALALGLAACSDGDDSSDAAATGEDTTETTAAAPADEDVASEEDEEKEHDIEHDGDDDHGEGEHDDADTEEAEAPAAAPVAALVVRRVAGDVDEFVATRDAYVGDLESQPGITDDREFLPFLSFTTFAAPEPPVYIGLTSGASLPEFATAAESVAADLQGAYFPTFEIEAFGILAPLDPASGVDIASIAAEPGQVLEVAWRDLSAYDDFDQADYEAARDAYLEALSGFDGFVQEYQWVAVDGSSLVVGMTVYSSAEAFQAIATDAEFTASDVYGAFVGGYPIAGGYASTSVKP